VSCLLAVWKVLAFTLRSASRKPPTPITSSWQSPGPLSREAPSSRSHLFPFSFIHRTLCEIVPVYFLATARCFFQKLDMLTGYTQDDSRYPGAWHPPYLSLPVPPVWLFFHEARIHDLKSSRCAEPDVGSEFSHHDTGLPSFFPTFLRSAFCPHVEAGPPFFGMSPPSLKPPFWTMFYCIIEFRLLSWTVEFLFPSVPFPPLLFGLVETTELFCSWFTAFRLFLFPELALIIVSVFFFFVFLVLGLFCFFCFLVFLGLSRLLRDL